MATLRLHTIRAPNLGKKLIGMTPFIPVHDDYAPRLIRCLTIALRDPGLPRDCQNAARTTICALAGRLSRAEFAAARPQLSALHYPLTTDH